MILSHIGHPGVSFAQVVDDQKQATVTIGIIVNMYVQTERCGQ